MDPLQPVTIVSVRCEDKPVPARGSQLQFCGDCGKPIWVGRIVMKNAIALGCDKPEFLCSVCNQAPLFDLSGGNVVPFQPDHSTN